MSESVELVLITILSGGNDPYKFKEAWDHPDPIHKKGWRGGIGKEFGDMKDRGVWKVIPKSEVPKGRRLVGCKWVFKLKKNGVYRARLVALGYNQIPGVDYTENFAPVVNDVTIRIVLVLMLLNQWEGELVDVEVAFLHGDMDTEVYLEIPEGMEHFETVDRKNQCVKLIKACYGTVQAARQWYKTLMHVLVTELGYTRSKADPCLLMRENGLGKVVLCVYVDDASLIGDKKAVDFAKRELATKFAIKEIGEME
jgi:hypothetical protein